MKLHSQNRRGASLIEATVAMAVIALSLSGIHAMLVGAARNDRVFDSEAAAMKVANELTSQIATWPFNDTRLSTGTYTSATFSHPNVSGFTLSGTTTRTVAETFDTAPTHSE